MSLNLTRSEAPAVEEHLSPERLALLLDCSLSKVRKAIKRRELVTVRVGRLVRIPQSSAARWIAAGQNGPE
jgi:excisionase family DNA binding protein